MSSRRDIQNLQSEFPDLSQSTLGDVLNTYQNDKLQATEALRQISDQLKKENEQKVQELHEMFPSLSLDVIVHELQGCQGSVDAAIAPLFGKVQELDMSKQKKARLQQKKKKRRSRSRTKKGRRKISRKLFDGHFLEYPEGKSSRVT